MRTQMDGFKFFKFLMISAVLGAGLFAARTASAATSCVNDVDCKANPACGGDVCDWVTAGMTCVPAGTAAQGDDGWCTTDADCKCKAMGATCNGNFHCTITKPPGGSATGGASGSTGGASGTGTGGAAAGTGGASTGNDGGAKPASGDSGGCSVGGAASSTGLGAMIGLAALLISRRRRGRTAVS